MADPIPLLSKKKAPTMLEADFGNMVIELLNSIAAMTISPAGSGKLVATKNNTVLDLTPLVQKVDAVALALQQSTPPQMTDVLNRLNTLETAITNLGNAITTINNRLDNASGSGTVVCNPDGSFTVSITINI